MSPLYLLFFLSFVISVDIRILTPVLPSISLSLDASPGAIGLAMTTYSLAYGIGQLVYGPLSDRLSRIAVVRAAGIGFCICTILSAFALTSWQFIAARFLAGAFAGAVIPLTLVFIGDTVEYGRRQIVLGRYSAVTSSAAAFSAAIGGTVAHFVSWQAMLIGYGLASLIPIGLMWRQKTVALPRSEGAGDSYSDLLRNRRAILIYAAMTMEGFLFFGSITYAGAFATFRYGLDQFSVGMLIALVGVGTVIWGLMMNLIRRFLSENGLAALGGALMGGAFLALIPAGPLPVFAVSMFCMGLGYSSLHTTLQLRGTQISESSRGKAYSLLVFFFFVGISTGSAAFGWLVDAGNYEALCAIAGTGLVATGLVTAFMPPQKNR